MDKLIDLLPEVSHKQKMFKNMLLAQIGFLTLTLIMIFFDDSIKIAIIANLCFATLIAYLGWAAHRRVSEGIEIFNFKMTSLIDYAFMRTNRMVHARYTHNDEIGWVLQEFDKFTEKFDEIRKEDMKVLGEIVLSLNKVEQGIYRCKVRSTSSNFMIRELARTVNKMIEVSSTNITSVKNVLGEYTQDNFQHHISIDKSIKEDMLLVMQSVNRLGESLRKSAQQNLKNGEILNQNAITMSESVNSVAAKANQQAASLEETAAALEEITSITRNNAQNATKMGQLGNIVNKAVVLGQDLATRTAHSMDDINHEVNSINEAIAVIDQIAFQTNILSLNAAVEAATAGEAGKGFAVVAGEVRNLATRSAEAAREIKLLVESAKIKANEGKTISSEMIKGYQTLNTHISETLRLIDDVSYASKEQMQGIEQINHAVTILDQVTQENASEANNVSTISQEVRSLADELVLDAKSKKF